MAALHLTEPAEPAEPAEPSSSERGSGHTITSRPNALAEIRFASIVDPDLTPSEDESPEEQALQLENVQSAIGVSIGQQQTRLTLPKTPAAEKAAALEDTDDGNFFADFEEAQNGGGGGSATESQSTPHPGIRTTSRGESNASEPRTTRSAARADTTPLRLPSPWRAAPRKMRVEDTSSHRTTLRSTFAHSRRRAMSGGTTTETLKKYMSNFNLPSMPKTPSLLNFTLPQFSIDHALGRNAQRKRGTSMFSSTTNNGITQHDGSYHSRNADGKRPLQSDNVLPLRPRHPTTDPIPQQPFPRQGIPRGDSTVDSLGGDVARTQSLRLRRSNSEGSLLIHRQMSFASSLGDDSRFEHVQEQVNSRLKAIKDSWQDSNFKLPSMPTMSNFSFGSRDDLFRSSRSSTLSLKALNTDASATNNRVSFLAPLNTVSRDATPKLLPKLKDSTLNGASASSSQATTHPYFTQALQDLTGDVVILGGYRGSILRSAEPPHRQLWAPVKVGLNIRKVDLELGLNPEDEETEEERIIPSGMLTHVGPIDIAKRLFKRLRACDNAKNGDLRVHNYGYDWRLSPHILSRKLIEYLKTLPCNQPGVPPEKRGAVVIAHSLGGLITRHAINQCPDLVAGVVYAGVPQNCINILGPLRNGDDVLLSSRVLTAQVNFTIRTSYALLPLDGYCFINKKTKEEYRVDFFEPNNWLEYRLSPCIAPALPAPSTPPNLRSASGLLNAMSQALPSLPGRKSSMNSGKNSSTNLAQYTSTATSASSSGTQTQQPHQQKDTSHEKGIEPHTSPLHEAADVLKNATDKAADTGAQNNGMAPQMSQGQTTHRSQDTSGSNPATACTIPFEKAMPYLTRTLAEVKKFKQETLFRAEHAAANRYPPIALIYGKSTPTVYGAKVESREAIKRVDCYDELAFASGDGVVLARAAMVPEGYAVVRGGVVSSDRGHVTLLGDLEAVGRCLTAVVGARKNGVGMGRRGDSESEGEDGVEMKV